MFDFYLISQVVKLQIAMIYFSGYKPAIVCVANHPNFDVTFF